MYWYLIIFHTNKQQKIIHFSLKCCPKLSSSLLLSLGGTTMRCQARIRTPAGLPYNTARRTSLLVTLLLLLATPQPCTLSYSAPIHSQIRRTHAHLVTPHPCTLSYSALMQSQLRRTHALLAILRSYALVAAPHLCTLSYTAPMHSQLHHSHALLATPHMHSQLRRTHALIVTPHPCTLAYSAPT